MNRRSRAKCVLTLGLLFIPLLKHSSGQIAENKAAQVSHVVLTRLSPPIYPLLARQARINGEVELALGLRPDATVGSVSLVSGHPMLAAVAIESAKQSLFECSGCAAAMARRIVNRSRRKRRGCVQQKETN